MESDKTVLRLSEKSIEIISETLEFIRERGRNFELEKQYWSERAKLIGKRLNNQSPKAEQISKLEKYGFVPRHCEEALELVNSDGELAYEFLMNRYFGCPLAENNSQLSEYCIERRNEEFKTLLRTSEKVCECEEIIVNQLWVIHLNLPYLGEKCIKKPVRENCKKTDKHFKFSHDVKNETPPNFQVNENLNKFDLEIRFPTGNKYPLEAPLVSLVPNNDSYSEHLCIIITNKLNDLVRGYIEQNQKPVLLLLYLFINRTQDVLEFLKNELPSVYHLKCLVPQNYALEDVNGDNLYAPNLNKKKEELSFETNKKLNEKIFNQNYKAVTNPNFAGIMERRKLLPAWRKQPEILDAIENNQVVVIVGETGCGKTTQVPQYILDNWITNKPNQHTEIICTQPRRIPAIEVSKRVASERLDYLGKTVGYQIRLEKQSSQGTRLLFCTNGILLRRLENDPLLTNVTHVIIDEVHERTIDSDTLLLILKDMLKTRPELKIILMSATLNAEQFSSYFNGALIVEIPGRAYPVEQLFLEDVVHKIGYTLDIDDKYSRYIEPDQIQDMNWLSFYDDPLDFPLLELCIDSPKEEIKNLGARQVYIRYRDYPVDVRRTMFLMNMKEINMDLIEKVLTWIVSGNHKYPDSGSILVFLPGMAEIDEMLETLETNPIFERKENFLILPLHSMLTTEEQAKVFNTPKPNQRKIVLATNIAESSITIDDCEFVIDCGRMKEKRFESNANLESLEMVWESKANAQQRKGRAGRVKPGVCFHLFSKQRFDHIMNEQPMPEICRSPLEPLILRIKTLKTFQHRNVFDVIDDLIEQPPMENVNHAVNRLKEMGALNEKIELTPLGKHLASLPVDIRIGKLILFGAMLGALDSALTIAATLSYKSPFSIPKNKKWMGEQEKKKFVKENSDHFTILKAYNAWINAGCSGEFAIESFMCSKTLCRISEIKNRFLEILYSIGFVPKMEKGDLSYSYLNWNNLNYDVLDAILCAALYPNIVKNQAVYTSTRTGVVEKKILLDTKEHNNVCFDTSSVNFNIREFPSSYHVYQEKIKTTRIFLKDCTMVPAMSLLLFSAEEITVKEISYTDSVLSLNNGWLSFQIPSFQVAPLLSIREELLKILNQKLKEPKITLLGDPISQRILETIFYLITNK